jgi:hypothetical protein
MHVTIHPSIHTDDSTGEHFIRYTPTLEAGPDERITFPSFEISLHEPRIAHEKAKDDARHELHKALAHLLPPRPTEPSLNEHRAMVRLGNAKPADLRELIYTTSPDGISRDQIRRHYHTRGSLIAECYARYLRGQLQHLHEPTP